VTGVRCLHCDQAMEHADAAELHKRIVVHYEIECRRGTSVALGVLRPVPKASR
jgi:hypothetical protein